MITEFKQYEPAKENRFLINIKNLKGAYSYFFRRYKLFTQNEEIILSVELVESESYSFNPFEFTTVTNVNIDYLNATGDIYNTLNLSVTPFSFYKEGDYSSDKISIVKMSFKVDVNKSKLDSKNSKK